jgi:hypothetical protein
MASDARPMLLRATLDRLEAPAGGDLLRSIPLVRRPRLYFAGNPKGLERPGWDLIPVPKGKPYLPHFWRVLDEADDGADLLWLEDDIWCAAGAILKIAELEVPMWVGAVSFFDFRNEGQGEGLSLMPVGRPLWGTQAIKIPARMIAPFRELIAERKILSPEPGLAAWTDAINSWDGWLQRACEFWNTRMALYSPSLVQHLGVEHSAISPDDHWRPVAKNFPEPYPDVSGEMLNPKWCSFHGCAHDEISVCPKRTG